MKKPIFTVLLLTLMTAALTYAQSFKSVENLWSSVTRLSPFSATENKTTSSGSSRDQTAKDGTNAKISNRDKQPEQPQSDSLADDEKDQVTYNLLFNFVRINEYEANNLDQRNDNGRFLRNQIKTQVNLTDPEYAVLKQVAYDYAVQVTPIHTRAMEIIDAHHKFLSTRTEIDSSPQTPPQELLDLNDQRNALTIQFRNNLRAQFGESTFSKFKQGFDQNFVSQFRPVPDDPRRSIRDDSENISAQKVKTAEGGKQ